MDHLSPAAGHAPVVPADERHRPEETVLYGIVQAELETFLARARNRPLPRRVFEIDILECPDCGGPMRILAAIHPPAATRAILECLGLPSRAPTIATARPEPEPPQSSASTR